jgi:Ca2+-binding EF-hand superfamily protein
VGALVCLSLINGRSKDKSGTLEKHELKACLSSLGVSKTDAEIDGILGGRSTMSFEDFATYCSRLHDSRDSADNVKDSFKTVAGGKRVVTEANLRAVLDPASVDYLLTKLTKGPDGYSYDEWVNSNYN